MIVSPCCRFSRTTNICCGFLRTSSHLFHTTGQSFTLSTIESVEGHFSGRVLCLLSLVSKRPPCHRVSPIPSYVANVVAYYVNFCKSIL